jgi:hypothetical protein
MKSNKVCGVFDECIPICITNNLYQYFIIFFVYNSSILFRCSLANDWLLATKLVLIILISVCIWSINAKKEALSSPANYDHKLGDCRCCYQIIKMILILL